MGRPKGSKNKVQTEAPKKRGRPPMAASAKKAAPKAKAAKAPYTGKPRGRKPGFSPKKPDALTEVLQSLSGFFADMLPKINWMVQQTTQCVQAVNALSPAFYTLTERVNVLDEQAKIRQEIGQGTRGIMAEALARTAPKLEVVPSNGEKNGGKETCCKEDKSCEEETFTRKVAENASEGNAEDFGF